MTAFLWITGGLLALLTVYSVMAGTWRQRRAAALRAGCFVVILFVVMLSLRVLVE